MTPERQIVALADQYRIHAAIGRQLEEFSSSYGIDLASIATPLEIDVSVFTEFDYRINFDKVCRLFEALATISGDDTFGFNYGQYCSFGITGPYGYGLANAPTFRDALNFAIRYGPIIVDFDVLAMTIDQDRISIRWTYSPLITQREQFTDYAAVMVMRLFQNCAGSAFRLLSTQLERRAPHDKSLHTKVFSRNTTFEAEINEIVLPLDLLDISNPAADKVLFEYMREQCEEAAKSQRHKKNIVTLLKEDFIIHMSDNDCAIGDVARRLGVSERTLQRRLADNGTSFWDTYESTKDELSMRLLQDSDVPIIEISQKLGYSTQSAYSRAVKRWHGKSPAQLRRRLRS